ncbi:MAG TPA: uracil-DNA glycosylase [Candidatus Paceibacterota bacterium]|nr:uracil-DNA glycosylase [Candidatus Paceibacterota bacterium]HMO83044.1 uracil-DNA glycosylase [Candidatus Paceibacterota bacterium]
MEININKSWKRELATEFTQPYFAELRAKVDAAYLKSQKIFPPAKELFTAFSLCPFEKVKVVILGQDPYHGSGQAHGLSFSVPKGIKIPPSLKNIYKELAEDVGGTIKTNGDLSDWAKQGVLLLNSTLTVEVSLPGSHQGWGWETFTDAVIHKISTEKSQVVFLLWGKYAAAKVSLIDPNKHQILIAPHPSPFSAYTGFFGCKHFSKTNHYLQQTGQKPIDW